MKASVLCLLPALALTGCVATEPVRPEPSYLPTYPAPPAADAVEPSSLFQAGRSEFLFVDQRAARVGDVLTIRLEERTSASKSAETSYNKSSQQSIPEPIVLGKLLNGNAENGGLSNDYESDTGFIGGAESDQSNSLSGTISAVVSEVLPNGLLRVQGEKWLNLNRGEEYIRISGLVRSIDVDGANTVSSLRLADARISYSGTGAFADSNKSGWLTRFFLSPLNPL